MLKFIKGEFKGGNIDRMFCTDYGDVTVANFWCHQLSEDCWILEIPNNIKDIEIYNAWSRDIQHIPEYHDEYDDFYNVFWKSKETYVFGCFDDAMNFIHGYKGEYEMAVGRLHDSAVALKTKEETLNLFHKTDSILDDTDYCFMLELKDMITSRKLNNKVATATLKKVIMDSYEMMIKEKRLSRLN